MLENLKQLKRLLSASPDRLNGLRVDTSTTVVINGFWRSGTTWIQELVAEGIRAKRIFEPFQARSGYIQRATKGLSLPDDSYAFINGFLPYLSSNGPINSSLAKVIDEAQKGVMTNPFILRDQKLLDVSRAFCPRVVVKYVKGALCLKYISDTYNCPVIHIYRDPRAVIASIKGRAGWGEGAFDNFSIVSHLLNVDDGRADFFNRWKDDILALEKTDDIQRLSGFHFLTEKYVEESFRENPATILFVRFEDLVENPGDTYQLISGFVGSGGATRVDCNKPSSTSYIQNGNKPKSKHELLKSWRTKLAPHHIEVIENLSWHFGMQKRLKNE